MQAQADRNSLSGLICQRREITSYILNVLSMKSKHCLMLRESQVIAKPGKNPKSNQQWTQLLGLFPNLFIPSPPQNELQHMQLCSHTRVDWRLTFTLATLSPMLPDQQRKVCFWWHGPYQEHLCWCPQDTAPFSKSHLSVLQMWASPQKLSCPKPQHLLYCLVVHSSSFTTWWGHWVSNCVKAT